MCRGEAWAEILEQVGQNDWSVDSELDIPKIQSAAPVNISALKWYFGVKTVQMFHFNHDKLFLQDNDISYSCTILIFKFDICIFEGIFTSWLEKFYQNVNWADGERVKKIYTVQNIGFCQMSFIVKSIYILQCSPGDGFFLAQMGAKGEKKVCTSEWLN